MSDVPDISVTCNVGEEHAGYLERHLHKAWHHVESPPGVISLAVVDDAAMSELHERYLGITGPTDVLTFELDYESGGRVTEGEIVICLGEARRQAQERGGRVERELLLYAVHGLLHLSGYEDLHPEGYEQMHAKEDEILTRIGVGPVFRGDSGA